MELDANKIKLLMAEKELTQKALAASCDVSRPNLSAVITKGRCTPITAGRIARALGVGVADIIKGV